MNTTLALGLAGILFSFAASAGTLYVNVSNPAPQSPYSNWNTAATNIQDAVDAANPGDTVLVTNGVYQSGGVITATNPIPWVVFNFGFRLMVNKPATVESVNGPNVTVIRGGLEHGYPGSNWCCCVFLTNGASLNGFTLTNGAGMLYPLSNGISGTPSGGVWCVGSDSVVSNCIIVGNQLQGYYSRPGGGGGAFGGTLYDCSLISNSVLWCNGGGACSNTLIHCTLIGNSALSSEGYGGSGGGAYACVLSNCTVSSNWASAFGGGAVYGSLANCTLTGNWATNSGGGAVSNTMDHCVLINNSSSNSGGGSYNCQLTHCALTGNSAINLGGGAYSGTLTNCTLLGNGALNGGGTCNSTLYGCTLTGNSAVEGGGTFNGTLVNCTLTGNTASGDGSGTAASRLYNCIDYFNVPEESNFLNRYVDHCCTIPLPPGIGNFTNDPMFMNPAAGDFHLQSNSPCINAGNNASVTVTTDFDGNPRISGGTVDVGAYEFQNPSSVLSYAWLEQYGLPTDGSADFADTDRDGMNNWQEWKAGTSPTDASSALKLQTLTNGVSGTTVTWQSVSGVTYFLQRSSLTGGLGFTSIQSNIVGQAGSSSFTDTNPIGPRFFYRVGVQ